MNEVVLSIVLGTVGLTLAFVVSVAFALRTPAPNREHALRVRLIAVASIIAQTLHFTEEFLRRFYVRFPEVLGLAPWPATFFVVFNLVWLVVWSCAAIAITRFPLPSAIALWFLAIASVANGVVHPILSAVVRGYFPGLWSSVLMGILGVALIRRLASPASTRASARGAI